MALAQKTTYTEEDYYNLPEDVRAELIDGQIYYQAAPGLIHQTISGELHTAINNYIKSKKRSCRVFAAPFAVKLFDSGSTIVGPDISVICDRAKLTDRGCFGTPDWIIEIISPGNPEHDLIYKLGLYARAGVREYWIADPRSETILVYYLEQKNFEIRAYSFESKIKVNIFDDFEIDFRELDL